MSHTHTFRPAPADAFLRRARRLRQLAVGHNMADYLQFCAELAEAQQTCLDCLLEQPLDDDTLRQVLSWLQQALGARMSMASYGGLMCLLSLEHHALQQLAAELRHGRYLPTPEQAPALPLLAAALQVIASAHARRHDPATLPAGAHTQCPLCDAPPVASLLRRGESGHAVRYACCALCGGQRHASRVQCLTCGNTQGLQYRRLAAHDHQLETPGKQQPHQHRALQELECCDACHSALKQVALHIDPAGEAFADDLASLALDILAGEAGYARAGFNPYFLPELA